MSGTLSVAGVEMKWDTDKPETVEAVRAEFDRVVRGGMSPVGLKDGAPVGVMPTFDPSVKEIVAIPFIIGG